MSNRSVDGPPPQWAMPGTRKKRATLDASPPLPAWSPAYQAVVSFTEKMASPEFVALLLVASRDREWTTTARERREVGCVK